jgi:PKD repeat protein
VQAGADIAGARVVFRVPAGAETVRVLRRLGSCPTGIDDPEAELVASEVGKAGEEVEAFDYGLEAAGRYCYAVGAVGKLGRPGRLATVFYDHAGGGVGSGPPVADFEWEPSFDVARQIDFIDFSEDPDGDVVAWHWDFGDGATSTDAEPSHEYAAAGSYDVTLTVTDSTGASASATRTVDVADAPPEF